MSWTTTGSAPHSWNATASLSTRTWGPRSSPVALIYSNGSVGHLPTEWAQDKLSTYTQYDIGVNFMILADEQQWDYTNDDRPLAVPPDSGYSTP